MKVLRSQAGGSTVMNIIIVAILGIGAYIGLQYIPQHLEKGQAFSILDKLIEKHKATPFSSSKDVKNTIYKYTNINAIEDLRDNFKIEARDSGFKVKLSYTRELNLLYEKKEMLYTKTIILK